MKLQIVHRLPSSLLGRYSKVAVRKLLMLSLSLVSTMLFSTVLFSTVMADEGGYISPRFSSGAGGQPLALQQASPLAGGPAAAQGGQFMDVQGNSIVLPASYCQSCPGDAGGYGGYGGAAGYGDPMAVDFGGYGTDQSGPHYFDVSLESVFLSRDAFEGVGTFISNGIGNTPVNPVDSGLAGQDEYEAGWRIAFRYDLGPLSVLEATYMGLYDIGFTQQLDSTTATGNPNFLFTIFSDFGTNPIGGFASIDAGNQYTFSYKSDFQSTEFNYRRYWMGFNSRVTGTFLMGARYFRLTEDFTWGISAADPTQGAGATDQVFSTLRSTSENDLVGFQMGGDGWLTLRQGLRIGTESKAGIYNNRFKLNNSGVFPNPSVGTGPNASPMDFSTPSEGNQVAFAAESSVTLVADLLPSLSVRGGYQVYYLSSLATVGGNLASATLGGNNFATQGDALYHGFSGGIEYVW